MWNEGALIISKRKIDEYHVRIPQFMDSVLYTNQMVIFSIKEFTLLFTKDIPSTCNKD